MMEAVTEVKEIGQSPSMAEISQQHSDYLRFRIDPAPILVKLRKVLSNQIWDRQQGIWVSDKTKKALANDKFVDDVMMVLEVYINPNNIQGNISNIEAHNITENASREIIFLIGQSCDEYQISPINRDLIVNMIDDLIYLTLSRAIDDGQRRHDDNSFKSIQSSKGMGANIDGKYLPKMFGG